MANDNEFIMYDKSGDAGIPQYKNKTTGKYEPSKGDKGAPYSMIVDANGNPITSTNKLPVDVTFPATQNVQLTGSIVKLKTISSFTVTSGSKTYASTNIDTTNVKQIFAHAYHTQAHTDDYEITALIGNDVFVYRSSNYIPVLVPTLSDSGSLLRYRSSPSYIDVLGNLIDIQVNNLSTGDLVFTIVLFGVVA